MASLFAKNVLVAGKMMNFSKITPRTQFSSNFTNSAIVSKQQLPLAFSRSFAASTGGAAQKDHSKGLPEQHEWNAGHLETYLRGFASRHNIKQDDVDHLIKTFITGPTSAQDFFKLDRESLASKIGKATPERTQMANLLVGDMWKETQATAKKMMDWGSLMVVAAAGVFGVWLYNNFYGKKEVDKTLDNAKHQAKDAKDTVKSKAIDAKDAASSKAQDVKSAASSKMQEAKSDAHDAKNAASSKVQDAKNTVSSKMHDAKDAVSSKMHDAKDAVSHKMQDAKDAVKSSATDAKNAIKSSATDAKNAVSSKMNDAKDSAKSTAKDAKEKVKEKEEEYKKSK